MRPKRKLSYDLSKYSVNDIMAQKDNLEENMDAVDSFKNGVLVEIIQNNREVFKKDGKRYIRQLGLSYSVQNLIDDTIYSLSTRGEIKIYEELEDLSSDEGVRRFLTETESGVKIRPGHIRMIRRSMMQTAQCIKNAQNDKHIEDSITYGDGTESKDRDDYYGEIIEGGFDIVERELELKSLSESLQKVSNIYGIDLLNLFYLVTDEQIRLSEAILKLGIRPAVYKKKMEQIKEDDLATETISRFLLVKSGLSLPDNCKPLINGLFLVKG